MRIILESFVRFEDEGSKDTTCRELYHIANSCGRMRYTAHVYILHACS